MFTVHAGEFLVGQYIEEHFKDKSVWVPTKDLGIDLLVANKARKKSIALQVKFSRDFLPTMKLDPAWQLKSCTWFTLDRDKLIQSRADLWVFVLLGFHGRTCDYLIIKPADLAKRLKVLHGMPRIYQTYLWVTAQGRAWLTRGLTRVDHQRIADGTFGNAGRDMTRYLNDWSAVRKL
jgi:hypothetical protein